jgi:hypothetical protein
LRGPDDRGDRRLELAFYRCREAYNRAWLGVRDGIRNYLITAA